MIKLSLIKDTYKRALFLFLFASVFFSSCKKEDLSNTNFVEFTIGNRTYKAEECLLLNCDFNQNNFYDADSKELYFVSSGKSLFYNSTDKQFMFYLYFDEANMTEVSSIYIFEFINTDATIQTGRVYNPCSGQPTTTKINLNITRNDNSSGGIIEGNFSGKGWDNWESGDYIDTDYDLPSSCKTAIYNISGKFRLKIQ
jgi:hypothetical protein